MKNYVELTGRLGSDPAVKKTEGGIDYCNATLATDDSYTDNAQKKVEVTDWHILVAWRNQALALGKMRKGQEAMVRGKIKTRKYTDKSNVEKQVTEIYVDQVYTRVYADDNKKPQTSNANQSRGSDISMM